MASKDTKTPNDAADAGMDYTALLAGCRAGEQGPRQQLYELCHRRVYRLMVRMVGLQDAADLTQQAFLQLFRKIDQFAGRSWHLPCVGDGANPAPGGRWVGGPAPAVA